MAVTTEKDLSPNAKITWLKAIAQIETRNYGYAISLLHTILKDSPAFLDGRKWLRRAEIQLTKGNKGFLKGLGGSSLSVMKLQGMVKKDPQAAILAAEELLEKEPHSVQANGLLRDAAAAANMPELVGFAVETMRDADPKNTKIMHELARHYTAMGEPDKAIEVYNAIVAINPTDGDAIRGGKESAARSSMSKGGWDQIGKDGVDYRSVLKNRDEAVSLEQQGRIVKSEDMIDQLLIEQYALYNENPQNLDVVRKIASLHEQKDDFAGARDYYKWAVELTKSSDPGLIRKVSDLTMKTLDVQISGHETWLKDYATTLNGQEPDDESKATVTKVEEELAGFRQEKAQMYIDNARKRVERNPTDLTFRYELGEQLVNAGNYTDAIAELQKAQNSPNLGLKAKYLLGQCFEAKNILNLALKQYEDIRTKLPNMDAFKKDVVYRVGRVYERAGDKEKYLACMTEIYEVDSGYLDVAPRVEGSYEASS